MKSTHAAGERGQPAAQRLQQSRARHVHVHLAARAESRLSASAGHQPAIEQRRQSLSQLELAELGEDQRHVGIVERQRAADAQRAVERGLDQPRRFGFVGEVEAGIDAGFERELVEQRQAERIDRADGDVAEASRISRQRASAMRPS